MRRLALPVDAAPRVAPRMRLGAVREHVGELLEVLAAIVERVLVDVMDDAFAPAESEDEAMHRDAVQARDTLGEAVSSACVPPAERPPVREDTWRILSVDPGVVEDAAAEVDGDENGGGHA